MNRNAVLSVRNVSKRFAGLQAVRDITLDAPAGSITAVIGPNGAGKTTLFNCITGLIQPDRSESVLQSRKVIPPVNLLGLGPEQICRLGIARTFQQVRLFDSLAVLDNVMLGCLHRSGMTWLAAIADRLTGGERHRALRAEAMRFLARVGLEGHGHELAGSLDHGNRRRVEIARALAGEPDVLLLDEPAAGMNRVESDQLMGLLDSLRTDGLAVLLIEHDMQMVMTVSDRIYVMDHGELLTSGLPQEVAADPRVIEAYLGSTASRHATG